ncbi:MAG: HAD family hydrolase [Acidobacteriota bacterium]
MPPESGRPTTILVPGLNCLSCAGNLTARLRNVPGVRAVDVFPDREELSLESTEASLLAIMRVVREAGWEPRTARIALPVRDIPYASPGGTTIERELLGLAGVVRARFLPVRRAALVDFVPGVIGIDDLRAAIDDAGYIADHPMADGASSIAITAELGTLRKSVMGAFAAALLSTLLSFPLLLSTGAGLLRPAEWVNGIGRWLQSFVPALFNIEPAVLLTSLVILSLITLVTCARGVSSAGWKAMAARNPDGNSVALLALATLLIAAIGWTFGARLTGNSPDYGAWGFQSLLWALALFLLSRTTEESARPSHRDAGSTAFEEKGRMLKLTEARALRVIPIAVGLAIVVFVLWFDSGIHNRFLLALSAFTSILLVSSPSLIGLAVLGPLERGARDAARSGLRFRSSRVFEELGRVRLLIMKQSGVITEGRPSVTDFVLLDGLELRELLHIVGSLAGQATFPFAAPLIQRALPTGPSSTPGDLRVVSGGMEAELNGRKVTLGTETFVTGQGIDCSPVREEIDQFRSQGKTVLVLALDTVTRGAVVLQDQVRPDARQAVEALRSLGIELRLITSDESPTASTISERAGIESVISDLNPAAERRAITMARTPGPMAVVVSGTEEGGLLACAAMGVVINAPAGSTGAAINIEGGLPDLVRAIQRSREATARARRNVTWVVGYQIVAVLLAAQILYPVLGVIIDPPIAALALTTAFLALRASGSRKTATA